jgi:alkylated DNA repair protein (DNA oxidative demethylase)
MAPPDLPRGLLYLPGTLKGRTKPLVKALKATAPPAQARTRGWGTTSAAMTNCRQVCWWSDARGYRYQALCPNTGRAWPSIPGEFLEAVHAATSSTPWPAFMPDACLINYYGPGAKMGLHQDRGEKDLTQPIVTLCLGDNADFMIGGLARTDRAAAFIVSSGDALVMGGDSRMRFHGIRKIYPGTSPLSDIAGRYSLTFRKAL